MKANELYQGLAHAAPNPYPGDQMDNFLLVEDGK